MTQAELKNVLKRLEKDLILAKLDLSEYQDLYLSDPKNGALMDKVSTNWFSRLRDFYWHRFALAICRLTDPAEQGRFENLTLSVLIKYAVTNRLKFIPELREECKGIKEIRDKYYPLRSKIIAHRDRAIALTDPAVLGDFHIDEVQECLNRISTCINLFKIELFNREMDHELSTQMTSNLVLKYLELGVKYEEEQIQNSRTK